jgi:hypothetical protein
LKQYIISFTLGLLSDQKATMTLIKFIFVSVTFLFLSLLGVSEATAQSTREVETRSEFSTYNAKASKKKKGKKSNMKLKTYADTQAEFQQRMKKVAKEHRKRDKEMKKPQYSDPTYFGHKKKPKIRQVGKRKMCKECHIVH